MDFICPKCDSKMFTITIHGNMLWVRCADSSDEGGCDYEARYELRGN